MRVLYIGMCNSLAAEIVNCFRKEGNEVYLLSDKDFKQEIKPSFKYKIFLSTSSYTEDEKYFANIKPDIVIFCGNLYLMEEWKQDEQTNLYLQQLLNSLNFSVMNHVSKFIFFSSSHVLDCRLKKKKEEDFIAPIDYKGVMFAQAEEMVNLWKTRGNIETVILRSDIILGCRIWEETDNPIERIVKSFLSAGKYIVLKENIYSPVTVKDFANAVLRCSSVTISDCYHAACNEEISESELAQQINRLLKNQYYVEKQGEEETDYTLSNERIKKELEWVPFYTIQQGLEESNLILDIEQKKETKEKQKKDNKLDKFLPVAENFILFIISASVMIWGNNHPIFNKIDFMIIYTLSAGLIFGIKQSVPSIIYACIFYIFNSYERQISLNSIFTNIETIFQFILYIFIGVTTGYTVDIYKLRLHKKETEYEFLEKEYQIIKEINNDNLMIKQEYQKQLLNYNTSFPKLYSVISKLTVLEPERIFTETIQAVKDIMEVETVAVYLTREGSSYMRLIVSSNEKAVFGGKSWNLNDYENIKKAFENDEVFIGNTRNEKEPALAAPIYYQGICIAALVIKEVPFRSLNLNYTNLFRTAAVMITSSIVKAKDYENIRKRDLFIPDTEIFYPFEFRKMLNIAEEKKQQEIAEFCVLRMKDTTTSAKDIYFKTVNLFRNTDFFGIDDENRLFILLGNTSKQEAEYVLERMKKQGIEVEIISYETLEQLHFKKHNQTEGGKILLA